MSEKTKMKAYMVGLSFRDGPLILSAVMAAADWAAVAIVTVSAMQQIKIENSLQSVNVQILDPEFLDTARGGGQPATVLSMVPAASPPDGDRKTPEEGHGKTSTPTRPDRLPLPDAGLPVEVWPSGPWIGRSWNPQRPDDDPPDAA